MLDEMYSGTVAEQLRTRGHDVVSVHDSDYRRLETAALAEGEPCPGLVSTTDRQFPRGDPATVGRLVLALAGLLADPPEASSSLFLEPVSD